MLLYYFQKTSVLPTTDTHSYTYYICSFILLLLSVLSYSIPPHSACLGEAGRNKSVSLSASFHFVQLFWEILLENMLIEFFIQF